MTPRFRILSLILLLEVLAGCATPKLKADRIILQPNLPPRVSSADRSLSLHVEPFSLAKSIRDPKIVGHCSVGLNPVSPIVSEVPADVILTDGIRKGFSRLGVVLKEKNQAQYVLSGRIERFWVYEAIGPSGGYFSASVRYDVVVRDQRGEVFAWVNSLRGMANSKVRSFWGATDEDIATLLKATERAVEALFADESFWEALLR